MLTSSNIKTVIIVMFVTMNILLYAAPMTIPYVFKTGEIVSSSKMNTNFQSLVDRIKELEENSKGAPAGTIVPFAGTKDKLPTGWLLCDGQAYDRTNALYADLFEMIGTNWGGDGLPLFKVPDLRGQFLRGVDDGAGIDADTTRAVGTYQNDAFQGHWHKLQYRTGAWCTGSSCSGKFLFDLNVTYSKNDNIRDAVSDGVNGAPRTSNETRPKNAAVNYIIKY